MAMECIFACVVLRELAEYSWMWNNKCTCRGDVGGTKDQESILSGEKKKRPVCRML